MSNKLELRPVEINSRIEEYEYLFDTKVHRVTFDEYELQHSNVKLRAEDENGRCLFNIGPSGNVSAIKLFDAYWTGHSVYAAVEKARRWYEERKADKEVIIRMMGNNYEQD